MNYMVLNSSQSLIYARVTTKFESKIKIFTRHRSELMKVITNLSLCPLSLQMHLQPSRVSWMISVAHSVINILKSHNNFWSSFKFQHHLLYNYYRVLYYNYIISIITGLLITSSRSQSRLLTNIIYINSRVSLSAFSIPTQNYFQHQIKRISQSRIYLYAYIKIELSNSQV